MNILGLALEMKRRIAWKRIMDSILYVREYIIFVRVPTVLKHLTFSCDQAAVGFKRLVGLCLMGRLDSTANSPLLTSIGFDVQDPGLQPTLQEVAGDSAFVDVGALVRVQMYLKTGAIS